MSVADRTRLPATAVVLQMQWLSCLLSCAVPLSGEACLWRERQLVWGSFVYGAGVSRVAAAR